MKRKKIDFLLFNLKMPKQKSSLGGSTKNAKRKKETKVPMYQKLSFSDFILFHNSKNRHLEFLNLSPHGLISSILKKNT